MFGAPECSKCKEILEMMGRHAAGLQIVEPFCDGENLDVGVLLVP